MSEVNKFTVIKRNYGHWDIWNDKERIYRIRGGPGSYTVIPDSSKIEIEKEEPLNFNSVQACMSYICDKLMYELIIAEGQDFNVIERWNVF